MDVSAICPCCDKTRSRSTKYIYCSVCRQLKQCSQRTRLRLDCSSPVHCETWSKMCSTFSPSAMVLTHEDHSCFYHYFEKHRKTKHSILAISGLTLSPSKCDCNNHSFIPHLSQLPVAFPYVVVSPVSVPVLWATQGRDLPSPPLLTQHHVHMQSLSPLVLQGHRMISMHCMEPHIAERDRTRGVLQHCQVALRHDTCLLCK